MEIIAKKKNDDIMIIVSIASCIISIFSSIAYFLGSSNFFGIALLYTPLYEALGAFIILIISISTFIYIVVLILKPDNLIPFKGLILLFISSLELIFGSFLGGYILLTGGLIRSFSKPNQRMED